jgi:hypothetical protein
MWGNNRPPDDVMQMTSVFEPDDVIRVMQATSFQHVSLTYVSPALLLQLSPEPATTTTAAATTTTTTASTTTTAESSDSPLPILSSPPALATPSAVGSVPLSRYLLEQWDHHGTHPRYAAFVFREGIQLAFSNVSAALRKWQRLVL